MSKKSDKQTNILVDIIDRLAGSVYHVIPTSNQSIL